MISNIIVVLIEAMFVLAFGFVLCVMPIVFVVGSIRDIYRRIIGVKNGSFNIENYPYLKTRRKKSQNNHISIQASRHNKMGQSKYKRKSDMHNRVNISDYSARNNPASGLPMAGRSSIDIGGNTFGTRR